MIASYCGGDYHSFKGPGGFYAYRSGLSGQRDEEGEGGHHGGEVGGEERGVATPSS